MGAPPESGACMSQLLRLTRSQQALASARKRCWESRRRRPHLVALSPTTLDVVSPAHTAPAMTVSLPARSLVIPLDATPTEQLAHLSRLKRSVVGTQAAKAAALQAGGVDRCARRC